MLLLLKTLPPSMSIELPFLILPLAALGAVLGWERALPLAPLRRAVILTLDRLWRTQPAKPVWKFLIGLVSCGECLSPYIGFLFSYLYFGLSFVCPLIALTTYALYVVLIQKAESND